MGEIIAFTILFGVIPLVSFVWYSYIPKHERAILKSIEDNNVRITTAYHGLDIGDSPLSTGPGNDRFIGAEVTHAFSRAIHKLHKLQKSNNFCREHKKQSTLDPEMQKAVDDTHTILGATEQIKHLTKVVEKIRSNYKVLDVLSKN